MILPRPGSSGFVLCRFHRVLPPDKVGLRFGRYSVSCRFFWSFLFGRVGLMILFLDCGKGCVFDVCFSVWWWNLYGV